MFWSGEAGANWESSADTSPPPRVKQREGEADAGEKAELMARGDADMWGGDQEEGSRGRGPRAHVIDSLLYSRN